MDQQTLKYYNQNALDIFNNYIKAKEGISSFFATAFPIHTKILDIGAGSGRDMQFLLDKGYDAYGIEPSVELRQLALSQYPVLEGRLFDGSLPDIDEGFTEKFDGVLCSAVLMHIPKELLFDTVYAIKRILKHRGNLLISIPGEGPEIDSSHRDKNGRLFCNYNPEYLQLLFERIGFKLTGRWETHDGLGREGRTWITLLFNLSNKSSIKPLDKIEGILNRDKKDATYKLALFRALCDISMANYNKVIWEKNGMVRVPVDLIAEKWIYYYWPLIESNTFIPQKYGEVEGGNLKIAFRELLEKLVLEYSKKGGLNSFTIDFRSSSSNAETRKVTNDAINKIKRTIITGPVTYSGNSLQTGRMFEYIKEDKTIRFNSDVWRELTLMSHWIYDAIILRWAELTAEISKKSIKPSQIVDLLLISPISERNIYDLRQFYLEEKNIECVWTGKRLKTDFDVDHVIPFSIWRNNDLWNLLPCASSVNGAKSDMLPTRNLLVKRKDIIIHYWKLLRNLNSSRFDYEVTNMTGNTSNVCWEKNMFNYVKEAVEITALQRNIQRWEPS